MSEKYNRLVKYRAGLKSAITTSCRDLEDWIQTANKDAIRAKQETVGNVLAKLNSSEQDLYSSVEVDELDNVVAREVKYEEEVQRWLAIMKDALPEKPTKEQGSNKKAGFKLPKLSLPEFGGDPAQWTSFWDMFKCSVDNEDGLSKIQKLAYLRGQLTGEAKQLIEGFKLESLNYAPAVKLLQDTYGQKDRIKMSLVSKLCNLETPRYNVEDLKLFYAQFEGVYKSLEAQEVTMEEMCAIMLLNKLPSPVKENVKREMGELVLHLDTVLSKVQSEIFAMEGANSGKGIPYERNMVTNSTFVVKSQGPSVNAMKGGRVCKLCHLLNHIWYKCRWDPSGTSKVKRAKELKLCEGCLHDDHGGQG